MTGRVEAEEYCPRQAYCGAVSQLHMTRWLPQEQTRSSHLSVPQQLDVRLLSYVLGAYDGAELEPLVLAELHRACVRGFGSAGKAGGRLGHVAFAGVCCMRCKQRVATNSAAVTAPACGARDCAGLQSSGKKPNVTLRPYQQPQPLRVLGSLGLE